MGNFFRKIGDGLRRFMQGRYGGDEFSRFLAIAAIVFIVLARILNFALLWYLALALIVYEWFRVLSRRIRKRQVENAKYLQAKWKVINFFKSLAERWKTRKIYKYYKCPGCGATVRIKRPSQHAKILITCPKCGKKFEKNV